MAKQRRKKPSKTLNTNRMMSILKRDKAHHINNIKKYSFDSINLQEFDNGSRGINISNNLTALVESIKNLGKYHKRTLEKLSYIDSRISDILHIMQLGRGKLNARGNAKLSKELIDARVYREKLKREISVLDIIVNNDLLSKIEHVSETVANNVKTAKNKIYAPRVISEDEISSLTGLDPSILNISTSNTKKEDTNGS